jgi:flagellar biosynthesis protein FlhB
MAEDRPGGEPTEEPTPKRLRDARRRGQVARSRDLTAAAAYLAGFGVLWLGAGTVVSLVGDFMARTLGSCAGAAAASPGAALEEGLGVLARAAGPLLGAALVAAALAGVAQTGGLFTLQPVGFKLERLSPAAGLRQLCSRRSLFEVGKALLKAAAVAWIAYGVLWGRAREVVLAARGGSAAALQVGASIGFDLLWRTALVFAGVAAVDVWWQRRAWRKELRMTRYEVRRELRESEGDPQHRAARERLHRDILHHDMLEAVRTADCVIVNPDHLAVALRYDRDGMEAPLVVAKGERLLAERIKEIARAHGVPVFRDVPLARALHRLDLGEEIPEALYQAVAAVLRVVYRQDDGSAAGE